jgi:hypothetical protein
MVLSLGCQLTPPAEKSSQTHPTPVAVDPIVTSGAGYQPRGATMSKTIKFVLEKEVKNSVRFKEVTTDGAAEVLGSLYVQKWYIKDCTELTVTLSTPLDPA